MLVSVGVNHRTASLSTLDALTLRDLASFYEDVSALPEVGESIVLQTCNRVDIFLEATRNLSTETILRNWAQATKSKLNALSRFVEVRTDQAVVSYLVRLASGLESMIVGESQILGQMKEAAAIARKHGTGGPVLASLFEKTISAGARVRAETGIGRGVTTIGSAAVRLAEQTLGQLEELQILLLGTGQVGVLVMKAMKARGIINVKVAGRDRGRTETFCRSFGGTPVNISFLRDQIHGCDLVVVATRSPGFLIDGESLSVRKSGSRKRLMILDLSNPRNVSPDVARKEGVTLLTIDDLKAIAEEGLSSRRELMKKAGPLAENEAAKITAGLRRKDADPIISDVYHWAEEIRAAELERALNKLELTDEQEKVLDYMSQRIIKKVLDKPVMNMRRAAEKGDVKVLTAAGQLFTGE